MSLISQIEYLINNAKRKHTNSEIDLINELEELLGNYRVYIDSSLSVSKKHYFRYNTDNTPPISNIIKPVKKYYNTKEDLTLNKIYDIL